MANKRNIPVLFIVSDNPEIREMWTSFFFKQYDVTGTEAKSVATYVAQHWPDIVLVDNPGNEPDDLNLCRVIRRTLNVPLIFLVENWRESHLLTLYQAGADDCVTKPVSPLLVHAKLRAWLHHTLSNYVNTLDVLEVENWRLVPNTREIYCNSDIPVHLTNLEFRLMHILMGHVNKPVATDFLIDRLWGKSGSGDAVQLKNLVYRLRHKIEPNRETPCFLLTISGGGYVLRLTR